MAYRSGTTQASSGAAVCTALGKTNYTSIGTYTVGSGPFQSGDIFIYQFVGGDFGRCGSYPGDTSGAQVYQYDICPYPGSGYTIISGRMACGTGPIVVPCPTAGTKSSGGFSVSVASTSGSSNVFNCADSSGTSCAASCNSGIASYDSNTGMTNVYCSSVTYSGSNCATSDTKGTSTGSVPSTNTVAPVNNPPKSITDCPAGSGFAQINNTGMCLAGGTKVDGATNTTSISGGGSTTSTDQTTINKDGTTTTTRTTTTRDAGGTVTGTSTYTFSGGIDQSSGNGNGGNDKPLNLGPAPAFDGTLPNDPTFNIKTVTNPTLSTSLFGVSASCPAPITFSALGRSFEISFQPICDLADIIRGIILMLSAIVAIRAVVTK